MMSTSVMSSMIQKIGAIESYASSEHYSGSRWKANDFRGGELEGITSGSLPWLFNW